MSDTTTPEQFATTLLSMVSTALNYSTYQRRQMQAVVRLIDAGKINEARQVAASTAGLDKTPPLAVDSIRNAVDVALPRDAAADTYQGAEVTR